MQILGGANLIALTGPFGSGKSLCLIETCLAIAETWEKTLVVSFWINKKAIYNYCKAQNYKWLISKMDGFDQGLNDDPIETIELQAFNSGMVDPTALDVLFMKEDGTTRSNCVVACDELGIFLNARNWQRVSSNFSRYLVQIRRMRIHLIVAFQFLEQVDKQFRMLAQHWIVCDSWSPYSKKLRGPRLLIRIIYHYTPKKFNKLQSSTQAKAAFVRPWLWAKKVDWHILPIKQIAAEIKNTQNAYKSLVKKRRIDKIWCKEDLLFKCFDSFEVLGSSETSLKKPMAKPNPASEQPPTQTPAIDAEQEQTKDNKTKSPNDETDHAAIINALG